MYLLGAVVDVVHANANNLLGVVQRGKELDVGARDLRSTRGGAGSIVHHKVDQAGKRVRESARKKSTVTQLRAWVRCGVIWLQRRW